MSSKTQGVRALKCLNALYQADLLPSDKHSEYVSLIRKGFENPSYYEMVKRKIVHDFGNEAKALLSQPQRNLLENCLFELSTN